MMSRIMRHHAAGAIDLYNSTKSSHLVDLKNLWKSISRFYEDSISIFEGYYWDT